MILKRGGGGGGGGSEMMQKIIFKKKNLASEAFGKINKMYEIRQTHTPHPAEHPAPRTPLPPRGAPDSTTQPPHHLTPGITMLVEHYPQL